MTVVRLTDGGLWLHSPTAPTEPLLRGLQEIGPVRHLVAPNTFHYWWLPDWSARFPEATTWGPARLRQTARRALPALRALDDAPAFEWASTLDQFLVRGNALTEAVFLHRPTRTIILTDLIENFEVIAVKAPIGTATAGLGWGGRPGRPAPDRHGPGVLMARQDAEFRGRADDFLEPRARNPRPWAAGSAPPGRTSCVASSAGSFRTEHRAPLRSPHRLIDLRSPTSSGWFGARRLPSKRRVASNNDSARVWRWSVNP